MRDLPVTASAIISFTRELEERSASFYEELAERFPEHRETFQRFAKDCTKHKVQVTRTYRETITDALEASYSFEGFKMGDYIVDVTPSGGLSLGEALKMALALEKKAIAFYLDVAERSESLLATIPRAFRRVAKRRTRRRGELEALQS